MRCMVTSLVCGFLLIFTDRRCGSRCQRSLIQLASTDGARAAALAPSMLSSTVAEDGRTKPPSHGPDYRAACMVAERGPMQRRLCRRAVATAAIGAALLAALTSCTGDQSGKLGGSHLTVIAAWSGTEQAHFSAVLQTFTRRSGVTVTYV